jgi:hypothetical protein
LTSDPVRELGRVAGEGEGTIVVLRVTGSLRRPA